MKKEYEKIQIPLTNECHLRCSFCLNSKKEQSNIYKISSTMVKKYLVFAREYNCYEVEFGILIGEPFLYPLEEWKRVLKFTKLIGHKKVSFFTSGIVYREDFLNFLNEIAEEKFEIDIKLSLYADTQEDFIKIATQALGFPIKQEHIAIVSDREPARISAVDGNNFLEMVKENRRRLQPRPSLPYSPQGLFLLGGERHWLYEEENRSRRRSRCWKAIPAIVPSIRRNPCQRDGSLAARTGWRMMPRKNGSGWGKSSLRWGC